MEEINPKISYPKEEEGGLELKWQYCKICKDKYWNRSDCNSIKEYRACVYCYKFFNEPEKDETEKK